MQLATSYTTQMPSGLPSPTLTNPDMILPFDSPSSASNSKRAQRIPSPPPIDNVDQLHRADGNAPDEMKSAMRKLLPNGDGAKLRKSRQENGKLEKAKRSRDSRSPPAKETNGFQVLASAPTLRENYAPSTTNPATANGNDRSRWDRSAGVADEDDSSPHSETSQDGALDLGRPTYGFPSLDNEKDGFSAPPELEDEDSYSHAAMSIRAEQILANAKKRLTNMEGNLNRARGTLHSRPSSSMSSYTNQSPEGVSIYSLPQKTSPMRHRQTNTSTTIGSHKGHARIFSETSVPSTLNTPAQRDITEPQAPRSRSALGSTSAEAPGGHNSEKARNWFWTGLTRNTSHTQRHNYSLEAVDEDGPAPASFQPSTPPIGNGILEEEEEEEEEGEEEGEGGNEEGEEAAAEKSIGVGDRATMASDFDSYIQPAHGLTRARSTNQMRDLRDQMQDLKGKISSLKERAREDSMRRRSLQSLRTPSPFTAAEQWYSGTPPLHSQPATSQDSNTESGGDAAAPRKAEERGKSASRNLRSGASQEEDIGSDDSAFDLTPRNNTKPAPSQPNIEGVSEQSPSITQSPSTAENDVHNRNEAELQSFNANVEEDSLYGDHDYHEASPSPIGERHEDRPDAFDYEHFFLHSGTGTLARKGSNRSSSSSSSNTSTYSIETTKPNNTNNQSYPEEEEDTDVTTDGNLKRKTSSKQKSHSRNNSITSVSTVATFATATEGKGSEGEEASDDEWILHHPIAGSWHQTDRSPTKRKIIPNPNDHPSSQNSTTTSSNKRHATARTMASTDSNPVPALPSPFVAPHPTTHPVDILTVLAAALPSESESSLQLSEGDRDLVDRLVRSLAVVCVEIQREREGGKGRKYEERIWRRRLDAARRMLDGEMNGELF